MSRIALQNAIDSEWVATSMYVEPALLGKPIYHTDGLIPPISTPLLRTDNLFFSERCAPVHRANSGMHISLSSGPITWILRVDPHPETDGGCKESTGLQVVENLNGHAARQKSNAQHYGDFPEQHQRRPQDAELTPMIDKF